MFCPTPTNRYTTWFLRRHSASFSPCGGSTASPDNRRAVGFKTGRINLRCSSTNGPPSPAENTTQSSDLFPSFLRSMNILFQPRLWETMCECDQFVEMVWFSLPLNRDQVATVCILISSPWRLYATPVVKDKQNKMFNTFFYLSKQLDLHDHILCDDQQKKRLFWKQRWRWRLLQRLTCVRVRFIGTGFSRMTLSFFSEPASVVWFTNWIHWCHRSPTLDPIGWS